MLNLPIDAIKLSLLERCPGARVVIEAPPGAGKSTALPLHLLASSALHGDNEGLIVLLQPRRVAALSIANFLAEQLNESVGKTIGYSIRGDSKRSQDTRLMVITEGIFTRWLQQDPELHEITTVIFDEFHERNIHSDLSLGLVLDLLPLRPELNLIIMSATLPGEALTTWLTNATEQRFELLSVDVKRFDLDVHYRPPSRLERWLEESVPVIVEAFQHARKGVLVFLPGMREIKYVEQRLQETLIGEDVSILHGSLTADVQQQVIRAGASKRVVLATNIAETSLTIEGIDTVVDTGRERQSVYLPQYRDSRLTTAMIAKSNSEQRAGRAARQQPGRAYRLWSEDTQQRLAAYSPPDVATQELTDLIVQVKAWGTEVEELNWFTPPDSALVEAAKDTLTDMGLLKEQRLTLAGQEVAGFGTDIRLSCIALHARGKLPEGKQRALAQWLATYEQPDKRFTSSDSVISAQQHFRNATRGSIWWKRFAYWCQVFSIERQGATQFEDIEEAVLFGFADRIAYQDRTDEAQLVSGARIYDLQNSFGNRNNSSYFIVTQLSLSEKQRHNRLIGYLSIDKHRLLSHPAVGLVEREVYNWTKDGERLIKTSEQMCGALVLDRHQEPAALTRDALNDALTHWLRAEGLNAIGWNSGTAGLLARLQFLYRARPELFNIAPYETDLLEHLADWALPYWHGMTGLRQLKGWQPNEALLNTLTYEGQQLLNKWCPTHWLAPSGRRVIIDYPSSTESERSPKVAIKLQEAFGEVASPTVLNGQVAIAIDLLSPAGRLLQRTHDLASFWRSGYQEVKKEMRGRYPKHPWPDDPTHAIATVKTKRQLNDK